MTDFVGGGKKKVTKKPAARRAVRKYRGGASQEEVNKALTSKNIQNIQDKEWLTDYNTMDDVDAIVADIIHKRRATAAAEQPLQADGANAAAATAAASTSTSAAPTTAPAADGANAAASPERKWEDVCAQYFKENAGGAKKSKKSKKATKKGGADLTGLVTAAALLLGKTAVEKAMRKSAKREQKGGNYLSGILGGLSTPAGLEGFEGDAPKDAATAPTAPAAPAAPAAATAPPSDLPPAMSGGKKRGSKRTLKGGNMCGAGQEAIIPIPQAGGKKSRGRKLKGGNDSEDSEECQAARIRADEAQLEAERICTPPIPTDYTNEAQPTNEAQIVGGKRRGRKYKGGDGFYDSLKGMFSSQPAESAEPIVIKQEGGKKKKRSQKGGEYADADHANVATLTGGKKTRARKSQKGGEYAAADHSNAAAAAITGGSRSLDSKKLDAMIKRIQDSLKRK